MPGRSVAEHALDDHALTEALRLVRNVLPAQGAEDSIDTFS